MAARVKRRYACSRSPNAAEEHALSTDAFVPASHGAPWNTIAPSEAGFDAGRLASAVAFAEAHESPWPRSLF